MTGDEYVRVPGEDDDPLGEDHDTVVPGLVHRYPDRVLFLTTGTCSTYCRYCTRSRVVGNPGGEYQFSTRQWEQALAYLEAHTEVRDVLLSGGDPLTLGDDKLDWLLGRLRAIKHIEFLRIGTKMPVVLPQRITKNLVKMLKKHHPLWMSIHFTHPNELTPEVTESTARLADAGIPLGSQTVLLKGINDDRRGHDAADARPAEAPGEALLPLSMRSDPRLRPFPHHGGQGAGDHPGACAATPPAMPRRSSRSMRRAAAARSSSRPIRWWAATATICCCAISKATSIAIPIRAARSARDKGNLAAVEDHACASGSPTTSARTTLRMGYGEEETAEFDSEITIAALCEALGGAAASSPMRIGGVKRLAERLAAGERWDARVQFLRRAERRVARGPGAGAARGLRHSLCLFRSADAGAGARQGDDQAGGARLRRADAPISR